MPTFSRHGKQVGTAGKRRPLASNATAAVDHHGGGWESWAMDDTTPHDKPLKALPFTTANTNANTAKTSTSNNATTKWRKPRRRRRKTPVPDAAPVPPATINTTISSSDAKNTTETPPVLLTNSSTDEKDTIDDNNNATTSSRLEKEQQQQQQQQLPCTNKNGDTNNSNDVICERVDEIAKTVATSASTSAANVKDQILTKKLLERMEECLEENRALQRTIEVQSKTIADLSERLERIQQQDELQQQEQHAQTEKLQETAQLLSDKLHIVEQNQTEFLEQIQALTQECKSRETAMNTMQEQMAEQGATIVDLMNTRELMQLQQEQEQAPTAITGANTSNNSNNNNNNNSRRPKRHREIETSHNKNGSSVFSFDSLACLAEPKNADKDHENDHDHDHTGHGTPTKSDRKLRKRQRDRRNLIRGLIPNYTSFYSWNDDDGDEDHETTEW